MLVRVANHYGSVTMIGLIIALLVVGALVEEGDHEEAVVAGVAALALYTAYVTLVRNHLSVSWRTVEHNARRMGTILALFALSVALLDLQIWGMLRSPSLALMLWQFLEQISHGLGVALALLTAGVVSRLALRQLRSTNS